MSHYAMIVFYSEEDGAWIANAPDLQSCSAFGETPEAAVAELRIAMEAWLDVAKRSNIPLPAPLFKAEAA